MIILDTNVVSEPMRLAGSPQVIAWLDRQVAETLFLTATNLAELLVGIENLPAGKRRDGLEQHLTALIARLFGPRVLSFDDQAAPVYAKLVGAARAAGHAISVADGQIAAIAKMHDFVVATRDTTPFEQMGVSVINPWTI